MKRIHPNASHAIAFAALAVLLCVGGCSTPSGGMTNPFLAPDRVPPPATRAILPGQAQPYYPGDPLPVMQSNVAPSVDSSGLAWSAPGEDTSNWTNPDDVPRLAAVSEPTVAIPTDNDSLRFALPAPNEPEPITPVAPTPIQAAVAPQPGVLQASYSEPTINVAEPAPSPWQTPQIAPPAIPPPPPIQPTYAQPIAEPLYPLYMAVAPNNMDVRLRAVASPPPEALAPTTPRIRMPGDAAPQTASHDGFRPRSSMR